MKLTGQLGDVMKESAHARYQLYPFRQPRNMALKTTISQEHDIHIHIPEGAVPKDGPSAGITMATAMLSAILEKSGTGGCGHDRRNYASGAVCFRSED